MNIELVKTPVTRDAVAAIDKENAVYNYTVLQFAGITETATLLGKATYPCKDGVITTADVELQATTTGPGGTVVKHRFVVIANVDGQILILCRKILPHIRICRICIFRKQETKTSLCIKLQ